MVDIIVPENIDAIKEKSMDDGSIIMDVEYDSNDNMEEVLVNRQKHNNMEANGALDLPREDIQLKIFPSK